MKRDILRQYSRWLLACFALFATGFLLGHVVCTSSYQREADERIRVEQFIDQMVTSALSDPNFSRQHSNEHAYNSLRKHANKLTPFYKVTIFDKTFHAYECIVTFANGNEYYVDVIVFGDKIRLNEWSPVSKHEHDSNDRV